MRGGRGFAHLPAWAALAAVGAWLAVIGPPGARAAEQDEIMWDDGPAVPTAPRSSDPDYNSEDDEIIVEPPDDTGPRYPSRSLLRPFAPSAWKGEVKLGGYWENELAIDLRQDSSQEDMIDLRSKLYGYGSYTFSNKTKLHLSAIAYYQALEGGRDRQQSQINLYEGYLRFHFPKADVYIGQMIVRWGAGDLFAPTNNINPVNYRVFIDPDTEDFKIPVPMFKTDIFLDKFTVEALYIPIFRSSILDLSGTDLSLVQTQKGTDQILTDLGLDPGFIDTIKNVSAQRIDFQEPKFMTGDMAARVTYRDGGSRLELVYFNGREDLPIFLYQEYPSPLGTSAATGSLEFAFDRYQSFGLGWVRDYDRVKLHLEVAASPERSLTRALDTNNDGVIDRTRRTRHPWQAAAVELDYLDPQRVFFKVGALRTTYLGAPNDVILNSTDTIYFLVYLRYLGMEDLTPEIRVLNMQSNSNLWFISPRISAKVRDRFQITFGLNLFSGNGSTLNEASPEFAPITIVSDNNQAFVAVRWLY